MVSHYDYSDDPACDEYLASHSPEDIIDGFTNTIEPSNYEEFLQSAIYAMKHCVAILEQSGNQYYSLGEEELNSLITGLMIGKSFNASAEKNRRGKIDITIEYDEYSWLVEAKLGKTNNYIFEGLLQILTRYATSEKDFGLLIYFQDKAPLTMFNKWCEYIDNEDWEIYAKKNDILDEVIDYIPKEKYRRIESSNNMLAQRNMLTSHGSNINIQYIGVNLYHNPLDRSGRTGKGQKFFHAKQAIQNEYLSYKENSNCDIDKLMNALDVIFEQSAEFNKL